MLHAAALLAWAAVGQFAGHEPLPREEWELRLGAPGLAALDAPERLTVFRVSAGFRGTEKGGEKFANERFRRLEPGWSVEPASAARLGQVVLQADTDRGSLCGFHPDHLLRFERAGHVVEVLTCRGCEFLYFQSDGRDVKGKFKFHPALEEFLATVYDFEDETAAAAADVLGDAGAAGVRSSTSARYALLDDDAVKDIGLERVDPDNLEAEWTPFAPHEFTALREAILNASVTTHARRHASNRARHRPFAIQFVGERNVLLFTSADSDGLSCPDSNGDRVWTGLLIATAERVAPGFLRDIGYQKAPKALLTYEPKPVKAESGGR